MKKILILVLAGFYFAPLQAQQSSYSLSLEQAIALAQDSSYASLNARREMTRALKKKWETTATGLPQINGSISYNNNIKQPVTLIPGEITGGAPGSFTPVISGPSKMPRPRPLWSNWSLTAAISWGSKPPRHF